MCNYLNKYTNLMPPFLALNLRNSMEAYIVHLAKGIRIFGQGYALKP
jgi:hypothetical protein